MVLVKEARQAVSGKRQRCAGHFFTEWADCLLLLAKERHVESRMKKTTTRKTDFIGLKDFEV